MSESTLELVGRIQARLRATVRRITLADLAAGAALVAGTLAALWALAAAVEAGFWLGTGVRVVLFWSLVAAAAGLLAVFVVRPLLRLAGLLPPPPDAVVAARIGARYPEVSDRLLNLLDLAGGRRSEAPDAFVDRAVRMLSEEVHPVPFERVEDFGRARRVGRFAVAPAFALVVFAVAAPGTFFPASARLLAPATEFARPAPFALVVTPGDAELVRGEPLGVHARTEGAVRPTSATIELRNADEDVQEAIPLAVDSSGGWTHTVANVRRPLRYRVTADGVASPWYRVDVSERPLVRGLQVRITPPAYTGLPPQSLEPNAGDVTALPGTRVAVEVAAGGTDLAAALLRFDDGEELALDLDARTAEGTFTLRRAGAYEVVLRSADGVENADPITYRLGVLEDAYPAVALLEPGATTDLTEALRTRLRARITDDYGFARLRLRYRLTESRFGTPDSAWRTLDLPFEGRRLDQEIAKDWHLPAETDLDPAPGDVIEYFVQVWDNDAVAGYKSAQSPVQRLRLPSLTEQYQALETEQDAVAGEMEELLRETDAVRDEFETLRDELRSKQEADWEDARQLENVRRRQAELEERVDELSQNIERMTSTMEDNDLVSEETLQKYRDLQKVAEEVNSPELREALQKLQESMENLDLQSLQQSLDTFQFNEEQYRQRLERTLELFERLRMEQRLEEAARRAEALAQQQERLAQETAEREDAPRPDENTERSQRPEESRENGEGEQREGEQREGEQREGEQREGEQREGEQSEGEQSEGERSPQDADRLARDQERAREEMEDLNRMIEEMRRQAQEMRNGPDERLDEMRRQARPESLPQEMQENAQQMRQGQMQQAQQGQQNMQQRLQQMQQQMQQMQQGMQGQQMQLNLAGLRRALDDILTLSQQQETLRAGVQDASADSPLLRSLAQRQVELAEGLSVVSDSLQQLARQIPQMSRTVQALAGNALREMGGATEALAERTAPQAAGRQKASMMHLNDLALLLTELMNQMMSGQSGGSGMSMQQMLQQMQQMAGQQQQLNEQIQEMLNDMQGNRLSAEQGERLRQMAAQQQAIREQLENLARNPAARGRMLGDLDRIAEQMEETIRDLQRGQTDRPLVERQQQILTRLLDAQRSLQQRGKEERREAQTGRDGNRPSPGALPPAEQAERLRRDLIRALESGYAPDYEDLIKRYFELLQQQNGGEN